MCVLLIIFQVFWVLTRSAVYFSRHTFSYRVSHTHPPSTSYLTHLSYFLRVFLSTEPYCTHTAVGPGLSFFLVLLPTLTQNDNNNTRKISAQSLT